MFTLTEEQSGKEIEVNPFTIAFVRNEGSCRLIVFSNNISINVIEDQGQIVDDWHRSIEGHMANIGEPLAAGLSAIDQAIHLVKQDINQHLEKQNQSQPPLFEKPS